MRRIESFRRTDRIGRSAAKRLVVSLLGMGLLLACQRDPALTELSLPTLSDSTLALSVVREAPASVFLFLGTDCPLSQNYTRTLLDLQADYAARGVRCYAVLPGPFSDPAQPMLFKAQYGLTVPILLDADYRLTRTLGATITPEAFLVTPDGQTPYAGAVDNWAYTLGRQRRVITAHYLRQALDAVLAGQPVRPARTDAVGCYIFGLPADR